MVGEGEDGHRVPLVQEDGSEDDVAEEATEVSWTQTSVLQGIPVRRGNGPQTVDRVGGDGVVGRGAVYRQQEGLVAPEDEGAPGSGRAVAPGTAPLGESGCKPPMVVGTDEWVEWAGEDVVLRGG